MAFFRLRLKIWANGKLIAMATDFNSFIEMPSISKMDLDWAGRSEFEDWSLSGFYKMFGGDWGIADCFFNIFACCGKKN